MPPCHLSSDTVLCKFFVKCFLVSSGTGWLQVFCDLCLFVTKNIVNMDSSKYKEDIRQSPLANLLLLEKVSHYWNKSFDHCWLCRQRSIEVHVYGHYSSTCKPEWFNPVMLLHTKNVIFLALDKNIVILENFIWRKGAIDLIEVINWRSLCVYNNT